MLAGLGRAVLRLTVVLQALVQRQAAALLGMPELQAPRSPQALRALGASKVTAGVAAAGVAGARVALEPSGSLPGTVPGSSAALVRLPRGDLQKI